MDPGQWQKCWMQQNSGRYDGPVAMIRVQIIDAVQSELPLLTFHADLSWAVQHVCQGLGFEPKFGTCDEEYLIVNLTRNPTHPSFVSHPPPSKAESVLRLAPKFGSVTSVLRSASGTYGVGETVEIEVPVTLTPSQCCGISGTIVQLIVLAKQQGIEWLDFRSRALEPLKVAANALNLIVSLSPDKADFFRVDLRRLCLASVGGASGTVRLTVTSAAAAAPPSLPVPATAHVPSRVPAALAEEAPAASDDMACVVCMTNAKNTVCMPCGHSCVCVACANALDKAAEFKCPVCRADLASITRLYV